uniref:Phosphatidylinositol-4-phosphate 3-kinase n=1 Tax=Globodera pallida TaxID=36090 RepID=A0A183CBF7_GLOPA
MEEEAKRHGGGMVVDELADLMVVEDPAIIQRNHQIEQIKRMVMAQHSNGSALPSTNPFLNLNCSNSTPVQFQHFHGCPIPFVPQLFAPPPTPQQPSVLARSFSATLTTPAIESQQHFVCPSLVQLPPFLQHQQLPTFSHIQSSFSFPNTSKFQQTAATSSSSLCNTTNPFGTPLSLSLHNEELPKTFRAVSPPLRVPFRSATFDGDLIDLRSPRNANSMALEEFDPLYVKLQQMKTAQGESAISTHLPSSNTEQLRLLGGCPTAPCSSSESADTAKAKNEDKNGHLKRRRASRTAHRMLSCDDLKALKEFSCDFHKEKQLLVDECQKMAVRPSQNVFFLSPVLDYFVIDEDTTIKLIVHQDDTWSRDTPEEPRRLEFTCGARNTSEEILQKVLLDLLSPEAIAQNEDKIPAGDYALKVYGSDEFLVRDVPIGKHPFVGDLLAKGRDVELEVGKSRLPTTPALSGTSKRSPPLTYPTVNAELFGTFCETLKSHVEKCLANPQDKRLRQPVLQSIKMITTFINNTQPLDLLAAIDMLFSANCAESLADAISCIVSALLRLLRAYCRCALTDFSVVEPSVEEAEVPECDPTTTMRDSSLCDEQLLLNIESVHNLPGHWISKYKSFFVEAHLMYGTKSYGKCSSSARTAVLKYHFVNVPIQLWADFDVHISTLPREAQVCFILRGVPLVEEAVPCPPAEVIGNNGGSNNCSSSANSSGYASARCSTTSESGGFGISAHRLASASLPLYNVDGFLLQGRVLVPLDKMDGDLVHPWGPRPLIRHPDELVLVVKCLEYDYRIQFPTIEPGEIYEREFCSLPQDEQETLHALVDSAVSHHLSEDDKELLWSRRNCLQQMPRAFPLVMASSFSWGPYSLGNIYALLAKCAKLPPAVAVELLLPYFQDRVLRECAVRRWLAQASSVFLFDIIVQLVEALRYETFENSALALFLLEQCARDRRYAFELYWQLHPRISNAKNPSFGARCQLLQQMLLELGIPSLDNEIAFQHLFLDRLDKVAASVKESAVDGNMNKVLHKELHLLSDELDMRNVRIPIVPAFQCRSISVPDSCTGDERLFNSLTKPIKLIINGKRGQFGIIYKAGDDLRQDSVVLQLVRAMNDIWLSEQLDLRMVLFRCMPTGSKKGLIELVPNCKTLREIQIVSSGAAGVFKDEVLNEWLWKIFDAPVPAGVWQLMCWALEIGTTTTFWSPPTGHVFHIDFGKYMGDWQMAAGFKRDRVPFVFTPEMAYVINGGQSSTEHFQRFVDECCQALNLLRKSAQTVLNIMRFLSCSDIPGMSMDSVTFVENNLLFDLSDAQATMLFTQMIKESLQSKFPRLNFLAHTLAQFRGNPLGGRSEDMNRLSFISELCNEKSEGRIESVHVNSYQKWRNPEKIYMYKLLVKRQQENVTTEIFRSFAEFQELHWKLCYRFSSRAIPQLCHTVNFGRTNIRAVAVRRQVDMQYFLQRLFALSDEVAHSELVYTFMHPIYRDTEPEARKFSGNLRRIKSRFGFELHWKLCYRFSSRAIPQLCHTVNFGRTNIRAVAVRRQVDMQYFLQRLFALSDEVAHSELVYTFMHPIYRDTEPEARKFSALSESCADGLSAQCQLLLRLAWDESQSELRIFVGHAKNLPLVGREQPPDSYVKSYLRWTGAAAPQRQWKRKTHVVRNAQNPTYNAEVCYSLSPAALSGEFVPQHNSSSSSSCALSAALKLDIAVWHCGNAVLKDNFQIAATSIPLGNLLLAVTTTRKGVREVERWFTLSLAYT